MLIPFIISRFRRKRTPPPDPPALPGEEFVGNIKDSFAAHPITPILMSIEYQGTPRTPPRPTNLIVTLWPTFPHFHRFANDPRIQGIRLNSAMMDASEIDDDFERQIRNASVPLWFDTKAMQLRITELVKGMDCDHLEIRLNRPIQCDTPTPVWFKAGEDCALLDHIEDDVLVFDGGPAMEVRVGESIHIRNPELKVGGPVITPTELEKIQKAMSLGFTRFYLSYVYDQTHIDAFRNIVGPDADIILKIENKWGLHWTQDHFQPQPNTHLCAARGDLFVEIDRPHEIMSACRTILKKDPDAIVGSRMLLSCVHDDVPSCADLNELAWLYDTGFSSFLLCDELCLKEDLLAMAVDIFDEFRGEYILNPTTW